MERILKNDVEWLIVPTREYDVAFLGGGLSATLLLNGMRTAFPRRVAVIDPWPLSNRPPVHWSYWSSGPTLYDRFAIGTWRQAKVADAQPEPIAPFVLRLVRSTDVLAAVGEPSKICPSSGFAPPLFR